MKRQRNNKLMMIFIDGVGIGKNDVHINPFVRFKLKFWNEFFGKIPTLRNSRIQNKYYSIFPVNATMGVEGLPQSGTGQTAIFCGFNASKFLGKHFGPYPYSTLKPIIKEKNIFIELNSFNFHSYFSNAYPQKYFDFINNRNRTMGVIALSFTSAGYKLNTTIDILEKRAITAEITNEIWNSKLGYELPVYSPQKAGEIFYIISQNYHFNLFEYFLTDHAGHSQDFSFAQFVLDKLDGFLEGIINKMNFNKETLFIISDHGNLEDLSTKSHTRNPALGIAIGKYHQEFSNKIKYLYQVKKNIINYLES